MASTPATERPRERCLQNGAHSLSLRECLALLLGTGPRGLGCMGLAQSLLAKPGPGLSADAEERAFFLALEGSGEAALFEVPGLADSSRARLLAGFEIARRYSLFRENNRRPSSPTRKDFPELALDALGRVPPELRCESKEWFGFIPCYTNGTVGSFCLIERGVRTHVNVDPVELFARLLALRPGGFFLAHNHPSGDLRDSPQDLDLTRRVRKMAREFDIELLGYWIVTPGSQKWIDALHQSPC